MRARELENFAKKYLLPRLPGFSSTGLIIYASPVDYFLRGFAFDRSTYQARAFTIWTFVQPLCIPTSYFWFSLGNRLGTLGRHQESWWNLDVGSQQIAEEILNYMLKEGIPFLDKIHSPSDFLKKVCELTTVPEEPLVKEAWCYAFILTGEDNKGLKELEHLSKRIEQLIIQYPNTRWLEESHQRILEILTALRIAPESAQLILGRWRAGTLLKLKLFNEI